MKSFDGMSAEHQHLQQQQHDAAGRGTGKNLTSGTDTNPTGGGGGGGGGGKKGAEFEKAKADVEDALTREMTAIQSTIGQVKPSLNPRP